MLDFLKGYKTYILAALAILGTWIAYLTGSPDPACNAAVPPAGLDCSVAVTLETAIYATLGALGFVTLRKGIKSDTA